MSGYLVANIYKRNLGDFLLVAIVSQLGYIFASWNWADKTSVTHMAEDRIFQFFWLQLGIWQTKLV